MNNNIPKYELIKLDIIRKINSSELSPNQVIPSENELCKNYSVSRVTIRKAIDELVLDGFLYKKKGKGSFVRSTSSTEGISRIHSFTEATLHQGRNPSKELISQKITTLDKETCQKLNITENDEVYILESLYFSDDKPFCLNKTILPKKLFEKLEFFDFNNNSLYDVLKSFYNLKISRAAHVLNATLGSNYIYDKLNTEVNTPLLKINATSFCIYDNEEIPFEIYESYILTDMMSYYVEKFN